MGLDPQRLRADFKALGKSVNGRAPIYVDNACMTLKPRQVIDAMNAYYEDHPSCHNRSLHAFGVMTTEKFKAARETVRRHIAAREANEIIFTRNTTEAINLVSHGLPLRRGEAIVTSDLEHNSNLLPWQFLSQRGGTVHKTFRIGIDHEFDLKEYEALFANHSVKLVSLFHTSHVTGARLPIKEMTRIAHANGALVLLDAAQALAHHELDVQDLGVDMMAFSFHKAFGPTGTGALFVKKELMPKLNPFLVGGETVADVDYETCTLSEGPERFEAGLQDYAGVIGAARALEYVGSLGFENIEKHLASLNQIMSDELSESRRLKLIGPKTAEARGSVFNFVIDGVKSGELSLLLDKTHGIMARSGVHCCHAWYRKNELVPSVRIAFSIYNTQDEARKIAKAIRDFEKYF